MYVTGGGGGRGGIRKNFHFCMEKKIVAENGFDPSTSGLWAQHASTAPLCFACELRTCGFGSRG